MTYGVFEKLRLDGKVCVVTGGAGMLGRKHAEALLDAGASVALVDVRDEALVGHKRELEAACPGRIETFRCDITSEAQILDLRDQVKRRFGETPRVLVNNAAIDAKFDKAPGAKPKSRLEHFPVENWNVEIAVGLTGSFLCARIFGTDMAELGGGAIVNIASDLGLIAPNQNLYKVDGLPADEQPVKPITYSVIKHGLIGMTRYLATYWADRGVRCNALAPGGVYNNHPSEFTQRIGKLIPMGRMARIDEYMAAVVFLASDASSYMTGAVLPVDGGRSVW